MVATVSVHSLMAIHAAAILFSDPWPRLGIPVTERGSANHPGGGVVIMTLSDRGAESIGYGGLGMWVA